MVAYGMRTGYDIKQIVDRATRHFWAASYGQIYPELKRLEDQGMIRGRSEPTGGRPRMVYELTPDGDAALRTWLESDREPLYELRDEGMLKLFFSDVVSPERRIDNIRAMRERMERKLAQLRTLEAKAGKMRTGPSLTLRLGITSTECFIQWCEGTERELGEAERRPG